MLYNFDEVIDRSGTNCFKYDGRAKHFGRSDVIPLWVADMDFASPKPVAEALHACADNRMWGYTLIPDSFYHAVAGWQERRHGWRPNTELMSCSLGVVPAINAIINCFTPPGGNVVIQPPVYLAFSHVIHVLGRQLVENRLIRNGDRWQIDFDDLDAKLKSADLFILCSPHNPLGIVWSAGDLRRMAELCRKHGVLMVSDEIHSDLLFHGAVHIPTASLSPEIGENVITCVSGTKTFNLAGLDMSTTIFPNRQRKAEFDAFWSRLSVSSGTTFGLAAMEAAFLHGDEWLDQLLPYLSANFDYIHKYCAEFIPQIKPNLPDATYLVWLDCRELGLSDPELSRFMVQEAGLGLNEGTLFGGDCSGFMRLNAACPRLVLEKALKQLEAAVSRLLRDV